MLHYLLSDDSNLHNYETPMFIYGGQTSKRKCSICVRINTSKLHA